MDFKKRVKTIIEMLVGVNEKTKVEIEEKLLCFIKYSKHIEISDKDLFINLMMKTAELLDEYKDTKGGDNNDWKR